MASTISALTSGGGGIVTAGDASGVLQLQTNGTPTVTVDTSGNVTTAGYLNSPNTFGFKNRIINGAMMIDQRNAGASVTPTNGSYTIDRWQASVDVASKYSVQQVSDAPSTFSFSAKITSLSAYSVGATETFGLTQLIEGFNTADLKFGTASAQTMTLSFWVKSSLTGTFGGSLQNNGWTRGYPFSYTISAANTWTQVFVTIAGDTTGTWVGANNGNGLSVYFSLGSGTSRSGTAGAWTGTQYTFGVTGGVSVVGTNAATWQVTGVQLEKGSTATSFDYRAYGTELALCQRYYYTTGSFSSPLTTGHCRSTTAADFQLPLKVTMRTAPTLSSTLGSTYLQVAGNNVGVTSITVQDSSIVDVLSFRANAASGLTAGFAAVFSGGTTFINASAEL